MSKILELAKTFEENSKQQASDIETSVNSEFGKHEQAILGALRSSNQSLIAAIDGQSRRWGWLVLKGWLCTLIGVVLMLGISWGVLWYQGTLIAENWAQISSQNATLERLAAKGGKLILSTCGKDKRLCVKVDLKELAYGDKEKGEYPWMIPEGY
ncbi:MULTISPECIES: MbeB family mobilization protein [Aeromonas]|uniref:MbeB family mobilization protein n=1 Tax=Aeromonas TaxID=642 RepID=UPI00195F2CD5|nr:MULTISPECIES: MbeB family mobilization protein [Aeromonas]MCJ8220432.1 MbeB family mobilization protein [Aeromonas veronii]